MTMSRGIFTASFITKSLKFKWSKINPINFFQWKEMMFKDIGAIAELELNEIASTWLLFLFCIPFILSIISSY